ncbi:DUF389 domain-containing protein [Pleomorphovibrio marinus]|uniref:DUF389 domain-containing protein n=1 Tax=Pleomorphovibrio marinus TaxID=2164132 RepID=UPI000E0A6744|nr:DUF389 domain-containing protein [Pleomorphovibrio marinus]
MKSVVLLYDPRQEEVVEERILPLFEQHLKLKIPFNNELKINLDEEDFIVTYLTDEQLKEFFPIAVEKNWRIGLLPHPKMVQARQGFGVDSKLEESISHLLNLEESKDVDLLMVNGRPVFNTVVIGESLSLMTGSVANTGTSRLWIRAKSFFRLFRRVKSTRYKIILKDKEPLDTACIGMVIVQHGKSNLISRRILEDSFVNDGKMHLIPLAPKSISGLIWFGISSLFRRQGNRSLPPFAAHIKTGLVTIESNEPINYSLDGALMSAKGLELEVKPKVIRLVPGKHLVTGDSPSAQEVFKVKVLPRGEERDALSGRYLPFIYHASTDEFKWLFTTLRENAKATNSYLVLMTLSTFIATLGLFGNSSPVIIGAMILAPLMSPIISLSMGVLRQDQRLIFESSKAIGLGMLLGYLCAVFLTWLTPLNISNEEILARVRPNLLDLGVAVGSGIAGAYAHAKEEVAKTLAGVAIAVALVPPLAVSGIGLGWMDWSIFLGALLLLFTNFAGMIMAAAFTFLLLGFSPFRLARRGILITLLVVGLVSLPLVLGFLDMVKEKDVISKLDGHRLEEVVLRDIHVRQVKPLRLSVKIIAESPLNESQIRNIKQELEEYLGEEIELEVTLGIKVM